MKAIAYAEVWNRSNEKEVKWTRITGATQTEIQIKADKWAKALPNLVKSAWGDYTIEHESN